MEACCYATHSVNNSFVWRKGKVHLANSFKVCSIARLIAPPKSSEPPGSSRCMKTAPDVEFLVQAAAKGTLGEEKQDAFWWHKWTWGCPTRIQTIQIALMHADSNRPLIKCIQMYSTNFHIRASKRHKRHSCSNMIVVIHSIGFIQQFTCFILELREEEDCGYSKRKE